MAKRLFMMLLSATCARVRHPRKMTSDPGETGLAGKQRDDQDVGEDGYENDTD